MSEKALSILSKSNFVYGLRGDIPEKIKIAHKFGERWFDNGSEVQLHDCGIVYYPENPYFLCVMTKGNNESQLKSVIKNISSIVYQAYGSYK